MIFSLCNLARKLTKQIKQLKLTTRRKVYSLFLGNYRSVFKGQGIDFEDLREYVPGDSVKDIDWNATARTGKLYVRKYIETKELTVLFAVDTSSSMNWGISSPHSKRDLVLNFVTLISLAARQNNDKLGAILFNGNGVTTLPFKKSRAHMIRILDQTYTSLQENYYTQTSIDLALTHILHSLKKRAVCFIITDNLELTEPKTFKLLKACNLRHELAFIHVNDLHNLFENVKSGIYVEDIETGKNMYLDLADKNVQKKYMEKLNDQVYQLYSQLRKYNIDFITLAPEDDMLLKLILYFKKKALTQVRS